MFKNFRKKHIAVEHRLYRHQWKNGSNKFGRITGGQGQISYTPYAYITLRVQLCYL